MVLKETSQILRLYQFVCRCLPREQLELYVVGRRRLRGRKFPFLLVFFELLGNVTLLLNVSPVRAMMLRGGPARKLRPLDSQNCCFKNHIKLHAFECNIYYISHCIVAMLIKL